MVLTNEDNMVLMARYPDKYFDLAIVDPPYGIGLDKGCKNGTIGKFGSKHDSKNWDNSVPGDEYFAELFRVSKNQIIWGGNYFTNYLPPSKSWIVWDKKQNAANFSSCELAWTSFEKKLNLFSYAFNKDRGKIHPTQKPVALYKWLLEKYAKPGDKILDTHLGSGSIACACHDYGFNLTACELDKDYFDAAMKRFERHESNEVRLCI